VSWLELRRGGERLAAFDYGGDGPLVILLHGLAGYGREWDETASWLLASHRVVALDQRGHGRSERKPVDMSRAAFVADVLAWLDHLLVDRASIVGQSLGGHTAFLVAARHGDRVARLVVAEASPVADPEAPTIVRKWLGAWPVPFSSRDAATQFFGTGLWAEAWSAGLEETSDGLRPAFHIDQMVMALAESSTKSYWDDWDRIAAPTLIVRGEAGLPLETAEEMKFRSPNAEVATIVGAKHDIHLEQPALWRAVVEPFLDSSA
jgi:pimeloyl-ACP methyl ester carboxylesterase